MRRNIVLITLVFAATSSLALAAGNSTQEPDYRGYVLQCVGRPATFRPKPGAVFGDDYAQAASVYIYLWKWTGRAEYQRAALELLQAIATNWAPGDDFFTLYPFLDVYQNLNEAGLVTPALRNCVHAVVDKEYFPSQRGDFNQTACRIAGVALALKLFPDMKDARVRAEYVNAGWNDWYAIRDTTENASNYNRIFWDRIFHLADVENWTDKLHDPNVHQVWLRYRDQLSPDGRMPGFGDSGPWHRDPVWIADFERAATIYQDPTLRWAAQVMWPPDPPVPAQYLPSNFRNIGSLLSLCYADEWQDKSLKPVAPQTQAVVLTRRTADDTQAFDKLVLAPSRQPGAPFVMLELFGKQGYHAHPEFDALKFYEVDSVPLLHGLGYNNRAPEDGNIVMMAETGEPFPRRPQPFEANEWNEATIPLKEFWPKDKPPLSGSQAAALADARVSAPAQADLNLRHFDSLNFRVENGGQKPNPSLSPIEFQVANVRLSGPGGEMLLEDFTAGNVLRQWRGGKDVAIVHDGPNAKPALKASCAGGVTVIGRQFNLTWDERKYDCVKFDWMLSSTRSMLARPLILRLADAGTNWDYHVETRSFSPTVKDAKAATRNGDSFGQTTLEGYFTDDSTLIRQLLLTREGLLIVRDVLTPGQQADGRIAGPIWHLDGQPERGPHWFDAAAENLPGIPAKRLLVDFATASGRTFGVQQVQLWECKPYTVFSRQQLKANQPVTFVTVLIPHETGQIASSLADGIAVAQTAASSHVHLPGPGGSADISISNDGVWNVRRQSQ